MKSHTSGPARPGFVRVVEGRLQREGAPYCFVGANLWYGAYLGADSQRGQRERLRRELDRLAALGVRNLRLLSASELSPLENSLEPAFRDASSSYDEALLLGLDVALAELSRRDMTAVLYLTNFWEWSGGMMTYLSWTNGGHYVDMTDPAQPWPAFPDFAAGFYSAPAAVALYHDYVRALVTRTNRITGRAYADDPTILSFQLANEPRPGVSAQVVEAQEPAYLRWMGETARLIKSLAPEQLVSTGSEGLAGSAWREASYLAAHSLPDIDYLTAHVWPQNWGWVTPDDLAGTYGRAEELARDYLERHELLAAQLGRPLVVEEFGFPRDSGSFSSEAPTTFRDRFYGLVFDAVRASVARGGPLVGSNFWAWGGEGRARHADYRLRRAETEYLGDPPHEPQGWYSVFDSDEGTQQLIARHAGELTRLSQIAT